MRHDGEPTPASGWIDRTIRLTRFADGIELYHPPLRTPATAGALALFGIACLIPGFLAAITLAPLSETGAAGMLGVWLMSIFILPFLVFGLVFLVTAAYLVANSLTVRITAAEIRSVRRVFGYVVRRRHVVHGDIASLAVMATLRNRWPGSKTVYYSLVLATRNAGGRSRKLAAAETLRGQALAEELMAEIVRAGRLEHLAAAGAPEGPDG